ncbi:hypothetical protein PF003_g1534 [Phytophthora fragariae]|nr:hypothetical protein PF003_g1534 [Phytophthora fragariae]
MAAGIAYSRTKWKQFWGYFRATWLEQYNIEDWNVHGLGNDLITRTNNPLERFHRELNRAFPTTHPNIVTFVKIIRTISQNFVAKLANVAQGRRKRGNRSNANKRKGARRDTAREAGTDEAGCGTIDLPTPVVFSEADDVSDSESEDDMDERDIVSDDDDDSEAEEEDTSQTEMCDDFSYEPGEYCDEANAIADEVIV